jgi:hypothetical protein
MQQAYLFSAGLLCSTSAHPMLLSRYATTISLKEKAGKDLGENKIFGAPLVYL